MSSCSLPIYLWSFNVTDVDKCLPFPMNNLYYDVQGRLKDMLSRRFRIKRFPDPMGMVNYQKRKYNWAFSMLHSSIILVCWHTPPLAILKISSDNWSRKLRLSVKNFDVSPIAHTVYCTPSYTTTNNISIKSAIFLFIDNKPVNQHYVKYCDTKKSTTCIYCFTPTSLVYHRVSLGQSTFCAWGSLFQTPGLTGGHHRRRRTWFWTSHSHGSQRPRPPPRIGWDKKEVIRSYTICSMIQFSKEAEERWGRCIEEAFN